MILVLGGTTEGRKTVEVLDKAGKKFFYSTKSDLQIVNSQNAVRITGGLDASSMYSFCQTHGIKLIIDAAHPFAENLHSTAMETGRLLSIPVIRFEREYAPRDSRFIWCKDFGDAVEKLIEDDIRSLLALTGVQTIPKLKQFWSDRLCYFRILKRDESITKAVLGGFPLDRVVYYEDGSEISPILEKFHPEAIITKESGESGGFDRKTEEALTHGVKVYVVSRPEIGKATYKVSGEYGLRKAVEKLMPDFFELKSGYTTGACATAAAKAALLLLLSDEESDLVTFEIPNGEILSLPVESYKIIDDMTAEATVIKDSGDDPDVTNHCEIKARVGIASHGDIHFFGGEGIGIVTLPGLGLEVGSPAINPVPRQMMIRELLSLCPEGCDVTISIPGGEEMAKKTFNPRVGVIGGLSIIGTSGVVMPYSHEAFIEAIEREMEVARASGTNRVVLNSGARSEKAVKGAYPGLPQAAFIHYGNAIGEALELAVKHKINRLTVGIMLGKAVKLAEGNTDTHSHKVTMNIDYLTDLATMAKCSKPSVEKIRHISMARELWKLLPEKDARLFFTNLLAECHKVAKKHYHQGELTMMLITDSGEIYSQITDKDILSGDIESVDLNTKSHD